MTVPRMQEQISGIYSGKIINKGHSKKHQATRSPLLHLLILPSSESFSVCRYKSDQRKAHTAAPPLGNSWTTEIWQRDYHTISKFWSGIFFFLSSGVNTGENRKPGETCVTKL